MYQSFIVPVRTVPAAAFTAISSFQMEFFCKNLVSLFIIVKVFTFFDVIMGHKLNASQKTFYICYYDNCMPKAIKKTKN